MISQSAIETNNALACPAVHCGELQSAFDLNARCHIVLHRLVNDGAQQLYFQSIAVAVDSTYTAAVSLRIKKAHITRIAERQCSEKTTANFERLAAFNHVAKIDNGVKFGFANFVVVSASLFLLDVPLHALNHIVLINVNVKRRSLFFRFEDWDQFFLPLLDPRCEFGFGSILFGPSCKGLDVGAAQLFEGSMILTWVIV